MSEAKHPILASLDAQRYAVARILKALDDVPEEERGALLRMVLEGISAQPDTNARARARESGEAS